MTTPDGGTDPHRDDWKPVPLTLKTYDRESKTYVIEFEAPKQLTLHPEYHAMVHDEILRNADRDGLMLEGQVVITERETGTEPKDPTLAQDATVHEVLLDPSKEEQVAVEQDAIESPYKMSEAEKAYRQRMRQSMRETAEEAFGFVNRTLGEDVVIEGKKFQVDRNAFMEGFFGGPPVTKKNDRMIVRVEAMVAMDSGLLADDSTRDEHATEEDIEQQVADIEIPDDLSGLDGE